MVMYFGYGMRMSGEHKKIDGQLRYLPCIEWKGKNQKYEINKEIISASTSDESINKDVSGTGSEDSIIVSI